MLYFSQTEDSGLAQPKPLTCTTSLYKVNTRCVLNTLLVYCLHISLPERAQALGHSIVVLEERKSCVVVCRGGVGPQCVFMTSAEQNKTEQYTLMGYGFGIAFKSMRTINNIRAGTTFYIQLCANVVIGDSCRYVAGTNTNRSVYVAFSLAPRLSPAHAHEKCCWHRAM